MVVGMSRDGGDAFKKDTERSQHVRVSKSAAHDTPHTNALKHTG